MIKSCVVDFSQSRIVPGPFLLDSLEMQKDRNEKSPGNRLSLKPAEEFRNGRRENQSYTN